MAAAISPMDNFRPDVPGSGSSPPSKQRGHLVVETPGFRKQPLAPAAQLTLGRDPVSAAAKADRRVAGRELRLLCAGRHRSPPLRDHGDRVYHLGDRVAEVAGLALGRTQLLRPPTSRANRIVEHEPAGSICQCITAFAAHAAADRRLIAADFTGW